MHEITINLMTIENVIDIKNDDKKNSKRETNYYHRYNQSPIVGLCFTDQTVFHDVLCSSFFTVFGGISFHFLCNSAFWALLVSKFYAYWNYVSSYFFVHSYFSLSFMFLRIFIYFIIYWSAFYIVNSFSFIDGNLLNFNKSIFRQSLLDFRLFHSSSHKHWLMNSWYLEKRLKDIK